MTRKSSTKEADMIYHREMLSLDWLEDGIAELVFHAPGSVNKLDTQTVICLNEVVILLEKLPQLHGLLLRSDTSTFIAGADITEFLSLFTSPVEQLTQWLTFANSIFNRLEDLPVPTVSAINGYALGGGFECVLATDFRVASEDARLGLPETRLGIIPGFGGSVRLPRLSGADNALELITTGKEIDAYQALKTGLVDAVVSTDILFIAALKVLKDAIAGKHNWHTRRQIKQAPLTLSPTESTMVFTTAKARVMQKVGKHYPAPFTVIRTIAASATLSRDAALEQETAAFVSLAHSPEAHALIGTFLNEKQVKAKARQLAHGISSPQRVAVLGAGIMGGGIAWQSVWQGIPVILKDISQQALHNGMTEVANLMNKQLARGRIDSMKMATLLSHVQPTLHYNDFSQVDIAVEAVVENPEIKTTVLTEAESRIRSDAILTSNTSTIPISHLARMLKRPENFCGMHFFNPVSRMPLVEIIRGQKTADSTIAKVVSWARHMGKIPIVVNDCPGFFVNRVLFPYFSAFNLLLRDGVDFRRIDQVMEQQFGWPMGPSWLLDVVGIDTIHHAQQVMTAAFPQRMQNPVPDAIDVLFTAGRYGQKTRCGFWRWVPDNNSMKKTYDPDTEQLLQTCCQSTKELTDQQIINRMMIPMINEVIRCLEEGVIASPAEADLALVCGLGFPPFRGGIFRYLDIQGNPAFITLSEPFTELGTLYQLPALLREKAVLGESWYPPTSPTHDQIRHLTRGV